MSASRRDFFNANFKYGVFEALSADRAVEREKFAYVISWIRLYLYMDALIVYPRNKEQMDALKAVMKAMKIAFEQKGEVYPNRVINGVKDSLKEAENKQLTPYNGIKEMLNEG